MSETQLKRRSGSTKRRLLVVLGLVILLGVIVAFAPLIVAKTSLRDGLLSWIAGEGVRVTATDAEFGWRGPLELDELRVAVGEDDFLLMSERVSAAKSWPVLAADLPHLGSVRLTRPRIDLEVSQLFQQPGVESEAEPYPLTVEAFIDDGSVRLRMERLAEPILELEGLTAHLVIEQLPEGRMLILDPIDVLKDYPLNPELCSEGLHLIAPILASVGTVEGTLSLRLENFRIPLDGGSREDLTDIEGVLRLDDVQTGFGNPVLNEAVGNLAALFGFETPDKIRIADEARIEFAVANHRVRHEDLSFKIPEVTGERIWRSQGSVGFDESLDLTIFAPLPFDKILDERLARRMSQEPFAFHVGGTIASPELTLPEDSDWVTTLAELVMGQGGSPDRDVDSFVDYLQAAIETGEVAMTLWDWTREWWGESE